MFFVLYKNNNGEDDGVYDGDDCGGDGGFSCQSQH